MNQEVAVSQSIKDFIRWVVEGARQGSGLICQDDIVARVGKRFPKISVSREQLAPLIATEALRRRVAIEFDRTEFPHARIR